MTNPYGPWATAIDPGRNPQLSAFWQHRLTMLVPTSRTSPVLSRCNLLGLFAAAALVCVLPTLHVEPVAGQQQTPATSKSNTNFSRHPGDVIIPTSPEGKPDKSAILAQLRKQRFRQIEVMHAGQANYRSVTRSWRLDEKKIGIEPTYTTTVKGKVYFDRDNFCLDADGRQTPSTTVLLHADGRTTPSEADHDDISNHKILTKKWMADWDGQSDVVFLSDPGTVDFRPDRVDPRVISTVFVANFERLDVKQVSYEGHNCYRLEEVSPGEGVRVVQILDPEKDFVLLRRETLFDNATRGAREKLREDYPFYIFTFGYEEDRGSGIWALAKCVWQQFETIPLTESRKPTLGSEVTTEFAAYSFNQPPAKVFTLNRLRALGARRLRDDRKGHANENWYSLPHSGNLADPMFVPDVKSLPPDLAEQWLKDAAALP